MSQVTVRSTQALEAMFNARSIAVVGASDSPQKMGSEVFNALQNAPFAGRLYPINPTRSQIHGVRCYPSVKDVPEQLDYAMIAVPADQALSAVSDCAAAGVLTVQILSAGFGEVSEQGKDTEAAILHTARAAGMTVIGPNCLGSYCSRTRISWTDKFRFEEGNIAFVSQSGGLCMDALGIGQERDIRFSKVLSIGNSIDLDWADYFRYLGQDKSTALVGAYIESTRDGRGLVAALADLTPAKPVLVLKGGKTNAGLNSVSSHTGQLAGDYAIWKAALRQSGAVEVPSLDAMISCWEALQRWGSVPSGGVALIGNGGGATVLATDSFEGAGLKLARLREESLSALRRAIPYAGVVGSEGNPLDLPARRLIEHSGARLAEILRTVVGDAGVGAIVVHVNLAMPSFGARHPDVTELFGYLARRVAELGGAKVLLVLRSDGSEYVEGLRRATAAAFRGIARVPVFASLEEAAICLHVLARLAR